MEKKIKRQESISSESDKSESEEMIPLVKNNLKRNNSLIKK